MYIVFVAAYTRYLSSFGRQKVQQCVNERFPHVQAAMQQGKVSSPREIAAINKEREDQTIRVQLTFLQPRVHECVGNLLTALFAEFLRRPSAAESSEEDYYELQTNVELMEFLEDA